MENSGVSRQILLFIDGLIVMSSFWIVAFMRAPIRALLGQSQVEQFVLENLSLVIIVSIPMVPLVLEALGFYTVNYRWRVNLKKLISGLIFCSFVTLLIMIVTRSVVESRFFMLNYPITLFMLLSLRSYIVHHFIKSKAGKDSLKKSVQIFGSSEEVEKFVTDVNDERGMSWDIQEPIDLLNEETEGLVNLMKERSVATAIFLTGDLPYNKVSNVVELCESMGVEALVVTDFLRAKLSVPDIDTVGGRTMIALRSTPSLSYSLLGKKALDRLGALVLIFLTLPFWIIAAVGIFLKSKGPVFFKQKRAGLYGRPFVMWKFRTMHTDAEAQLAKVKKEVGNQMDGPVFKLDHDPRVFGWGSFLRKTSIDELPQLINVLKGEMSLVGPRPLPLYEVEEFQKSEHRRRLSVKPGITCLWQAGGRNSITSFEEWVDMDLDYIDNWSFFLDLKILLMTVPAVLMSKGAK